MPQFPSLEQLDAARFDTPAILKKLASSSRRLAELKGIAASIPNQGILINTLVWCLKSNHQIMVLAARATDAKMVSALLCHTNGLGSSL